MSAAASRVGIVGLGLIGGSFALALRAGGYAGTLHGFGRRSLSAAVEQGVIDVAHTDLASMARAVDVLMLAVPMGRMREMLDTIAASGSTAIVTDAGSVKASFVADARAAGVALSRLVPGHPIAGRERSGLEAADGELFQDRRVILTPLESTAPEATALVQALWECCGARVERLEVGHHDRVLAATSHLPHMLAYALVDALQGMQEKEEIFRYAAGGFRDFSRIASSDPTMWRDVALHNKDALRDVMATLRAHWDALDQAIEAQDGEQLFALFSRARSTRENWLESAQRQDQHRS